MLDLREGKEEKVWEGGIPYTEQLLIENLLNSHCSGADWLLYPDAILASSSVIKALELVNLVG